MFRSVIGASLVLAVGCGKDEPRDKPERLLIELQGRMTSATYYDRSGSDLQAALKLEYSYDDQGHLVEILKSKRAGADWAEVQRDAIAWNSDGYVERITSTPAEDRRRPRETLWTFEYDGDGNLVHEEYRVGTGDDQVLKNVFDNAFDRLRRITERVGKAPGPDGALEERSRTVFTRRDDGKVTERVDEYLEGDDWVKALRFELDYAGGEVAELQVSHHVNGGWVGNTGYRFAFADDRLATVTGTHFEETTDSWISTEEFVYHYADSAAPVGVAISALTDGARAEQYTRDYTYEDGPFVLPNNYLRTRLQGVSDPGLVAHLWLMMEHAGWGAVRLPMR
jgi:hypothetical protein